MKRICALTMVRDDEFFLRKWVDYYGAQFGRENLYIFFDGRDQRVPDFCRGANVVVCERVKGSIHRADRGRIDFLSREAARLFRRYDIVVGTDVDEFLIVDPASGLSLAEYLSQLPSGHASVSALGIDVGQHLGLETAIDPTRPFLEQRRHGYLSTRYTKANILCRPAAWGSGFHRVRHHNFHIDPQLYLFHFGCIDLGRLKARWGEAERSANGWGHHLLKRARTIDIVSRTAPTPWDEATDRARRLQRLIRPIYAWNKPAMLGIKLVVRIPNRFSKIV